MVSFETPPKLVKDSVTTAVAVSPAVTEAVDEEIASEGPVMIALEGPAERTPNPKAATNASAIRLKVVLIDISFLSIVVRETISLAALR